MSSRESETLDLRHVGEVAAVIARHAQQVLDSRRSLSSPALQTYWQSSRQRADLWQFTLDDALDASKRDQPLGKHTVGAVTSVIAEVLSTELVTRLWTAVLVGHEELHKTQNETLARRVLADHLTARRSCLRLLTHPIALASGDILALNRIRQRAERWTDCLLATLPKVCNPAEFAFDLDRYHEFTEDSDVMSKISSRFSGWHLLALSLRVAEQGGPATNRARNLLHREVLNSIGEVIEARQEVTGLEASVSQIQDDDDDDVEVPHVDAPSSPETQVDGPGTHQLSDASEDIDLTDEVETVLEANFGNTTKPVDGIERVQPEEADVTQEPGVVENLPAAARPVEDPSAENSDRPPRFTLDGQQLLSFVDELDPEASVTVTESGLKFRTLLTRRRPSADF